MSLESITATYGYWALLIGTFFEGETILIIGGFFAHLGYLKLPWVILVSFIGTLVGDQLYFFIGRFKGQKFLSKRPVWKTRSDKIQKLLERYQTLILLGFRFIYGFRTIAPLAIGVSNVKTGYFIILNIISALLWSIVIGVGGYLFGFTLEAIIGNIKHYEYEVIVLIATVGILIWIFHFYRRRTYKNRQLNVGKL